MQLQLPRDDTRDNGVAALVAQVAISAPSTPMTEYLPTPTGTHPATLLGPSSGEDAFAPHPSGRVARVALDPTQALVLPPSFIGGTSAYLASPVGVAVRAAAAAGAVDEAAAAAADAASVGTASNDSSRPLLDSSRGPPLLAPLRPRRLTAHQRLAATPH